MKRIMIKKGTGERVPFDPNKIKRSVKRAGGDTEVQDKILEVVEKQLRPGITTEEIYQTVNEELRTLEPVVGAKFQLRSSLLRLGPAGYNFERYVAAILNAYGYKTQLPYELQGACVSHEVDVIAEKDGRRMFIEAKFRNQFNDVVNIKDTMATWSRFLDLVEGSRLGLCPHFDEAWIVTNARFTSHSLKFGHCKNMVMVGWNHPKERTFAKMVDLQTLYPLTIIDDLTDEEIQVFSEQKLMLCREFVNQDLSSLKSKTGLHQKRLKEIMTKCQSLLD